MWSIGITAMEMAESQPRECSSITLLKGLLSLLITLFIIYFVLSSDRFPVLSHPDAQRLFGINFLRHGHRKQLLIGWQLFLKQHRTIYLINACDAAPLFSNYLGFSPLPPCFLLACSKVSLFSSYDRRSCNEIQVPK